MVTQIVNVANPINVSAEYSSPAGIEYIIIPNTPSSNVFEVYTGGSIKNLTVSGGSIGINIRNSQTDIVIENVMVKHTSLAALSVGASSNNTTVTNFTAYNTSDNGIQIEDATNATFKNILLLGPFGNKAFDSSHGNPSGIKVSHVTIVDPKGYGVSLSSWQPSAQNEFKNALIYQTASALGSPGFTILTNYTLPGVNTNYGNRSDASLNYTASSVSATLFTGFTYADLATMSSMNYTKDDIPLFTPSAAELWLVDANVGDYDLSSCNPFATRSDCDELIPVIWNKLEDKAYLEASSYYYTPAIFSSYDASHVAYDIPKSLANASGGPSSMRDYYDFSFGSGVHKIYKAYKVHFGNHDLSPEILDSSSTNNIISQTFGPLIFNGHLDIPGVSSNYISSSFASAIVLESSSGSGIFGSSSPYVSSTGFNVNEFIVSTVLSGVDLIDASGASQQNNIIIYNIDPQFSTETGENFAIDNPLIRIKNTSQVGLQRIRFNNPSTVFVPDSEFKVTLRAFIGQESGDIIGGGTLGIWIHTSSNNGYTWSYDRNGNWVIKETSSISKDDVLSSYAHLFSEPIRPVESSTVEIIDVPCSDDTITNSSINLIGMNNMSSSLMRDYTVSFRTDNYNICVPNYYFLFRNQVHTIDQRYVVEVFLLPDTQAKTYAVIDSISGRNETFYNYCNDYNVYKIFSPEELLTVLRSFSSFSTSLASRVASTTSGTFETSGGSRVNYRENPIWFGGRASNSSFSSLDILG